MKPVIFFSFVMMSLGVVLAWELLTPDDDVATVNASANPGPLQVIPAPASIVSSPVDAEALSKIAVSVTERPLFIRTRRPSAHKPGSATPQDELPRLAAVIVGPNGGLAIFVGTDGKSQIIIVGDVIGAFEIRAIAPGVVTLRGSGGDRVLHPTYVVTQAAAIPATLPTSEVSSWFTSGAPSTR
jgi:hypothetical protein